MVGVYAGAVTLLGAHFETRANLGVSLVATGIVACSRRCGCRSSAPSTASHTDVATTRTRSSRSSPRRLVEAAPERILPALVEELAAALKLPRVGDRAARRSSATHGRGGGDPLVLALAFHGQDVGRLDLARRAPGEDFTSAELRLFGGSRARSASLPTRSR